MTNDNHNIWSGCTWCRFYRSSHSISYVTITIDSSEHTHTAISRFIFHCDRRRWNLSHSILIRFSFDLDDQWCHSVSTECDWEKDSCETLAHTNSFTTAHSNRAFYVPPIVLNSWLLIHCIATVNYRRIPAIYVCVESILHRKLQLSLHWIDSSDFVLHLNTVANCIWKFITFHPWTASGIQVECASVCGVRCAYKCSVESTVHTVHVRGGNVESEESRIPVD